MIRQRRIALGLTQEQLASKAGVTKNYVTMLERGARKTISFFVRVQLAEALGIPATQVLTAEEADRLGIVEGALGLTSAEVVVWSLKNVRKPPGDKFTAAIALRVVGRAHPEQKRELDALRARLNDLYP